MHGFYEEFSSLSKPTGWTVVNNTADGGWEFNDPGTKGNLLTGAGGAGGFATVNSELYGFNKRQDTELTTPVVDLSTVDKPVISMVSGFAAAGATSTQNFTLGVYPFCK